MASVHVPACAGSAGEAAARFDLRLGVVSDVEHWARPDGTIWAYEPYVREMNLWGELFREVVVCAPRGEGAPSGNLAPYTPASVRWRPVRYSSRNGAGGRLRRVTQLPGLTAALDRLVRTSDLVLLRGPAHPALVARLIARARGRSTLTRWTGYFGPTPGEALARRAERLLVRWVRQPTLVYGPARQGYLIPFFPAFMWESEMRAARERSLRRTWKPPWRMLAVGRLSPEKNYDLMLEGLARFRALRPHTEWRLEIVGGGGDAERLRRLTAELVLTDRVRWLGPLSFHDVESRYAESHILILAGTVEGWSKTVPEAWAHGAVPLVAVGGNMAWVMEGKKAGRTFLPTPADLADGLAMLLDDPVALAEMSRQGYRHVEELSLERFGARLEQVLCEVCGLE